VVLALADELVRDGALVRSGTHLRLPGHKADFNTADAALWQKIAAIIEAEAMRPPAVGEIAIRLKETPKRVQGLLERAARRGLVSRVADARFFPPATVRHLAGVAQALAGAGREQRITPVAFRDQSGLGRNLAVEVLEYFDRTGYTRRVGEGRLVLKAAEEVFGAS
jgi:selenocysteine-specific elongation factor